MVVAQLLLGILTVLSSTDIVHGQFGIFEWFAEFHQLTGMMLFTIHARCFVCCKTCAGC